MTGTPDDRDRDERGRWLAETIRASELLVAERISANSEFWVGRDLTMQQLKALHVLRLQGPLPVGGLAAVLRVHISSVTGLVDRLHRQGLVERTEDRADRRHSLLGLSDRGRETVNRLYVLHEREWRQLASGLSDAELQALAIGLTALAREATRLRMDPAPLGR
ncbi:MAG: MarR family transcriptional regulator [Chloroflexi bacterium]|nr:MarR family transcriptional regulator [Chloroflexota bacterium]